MRCMIPLQGSYRLLVSLMYLLTEACPLQRHFIPCRPKDARHAVIHPDKRDEDDSCLLLTPFCSLCSSTPLHSLQPQIFASMQCYTPTARFKMKPVSYSLLTAGLSSPREFHLHQIKTCSITPRPGSFSRHSTFQTHAACIANFRKARKPWSKQLRLLVWGSSKSMQDTSLKELHCSQRDLSCA